MIEDKKESRFELVMSEKVKKFGGTNILVDTETGMLYLFAWGGEGTAGLTPLLGEDGKPMVNEKYKRK